MVTYNPRDWIKLIIHVQKADTLRTLGPSLVLISLITAAVAYFKDHYIFSKIPDNLAVFHQISGFIISLVLVFRINSAYDRWWEGRKLWGALINHSRNLSIKLNAIFPPEDRGLRKELQALISNYAFCLKEHLRGKSAEDLLEYNAEFSREAFLNAAHKPNFIAAHLNARIFHHLKGYKLSDAVYLTLNQNLNDFTDVCGACERIKSTPIPFSYSIFIKKIIFIYIITMPITFG
ncbi:MAG TPA: bestrophin family ion channel, partial [Bacteroidia bacterium]|nr:bestrophin family ion channel [Bacteroidia bacterium]